MNVVIGIDEVGRGCWAGPLLVVAYRQYRPLPATLTDSKLLSKLQREALISEISSAGDVGEGWVDPEEIDALGLTAAMQLAVKRSLDAIVAEATEQIIMDGSINYCEPTFVRVKTVIKADQTYPAVSAASVYAKVLRDDRMAKLAERFPQYGFEKHVGYGTKLHQERLLAHGPCALHRKSFKPVRVLL